MRYLIVLLAVTFLMVSQSNARETLPFKRINKVATEALGTFTKLINEQNYQTMGFRSLEEVSFIKLGQPFQVYMVRLDRLQKYELGSNPDRLLTGGELLIYPVNVKENTRSAIMVDRIKEDWEAASYGNPNLARVLTGIRNERMRALDKDLSFFFVVRVPALNLYFVGYRLEGTLYLIPIVDDTAYDFKAGKTMLAEKVFEDLLPAARKHDGLPR